MRVLFKSLAAFIVLVGLSGCFSSAHRNLASQAILIEKGRPKTDVLNQLGSPNAVRTNNVGQEEWYYYEAQTKFWHKIPFWESTIGPAQVDALQVILQHDKVVSVQFYIPVQ